MWNTNETTTGKIFSDVENTLECLYIGDYGQEHNIKADFLGYTRRIYNVPNLPVDLGDKLVVTVSTQKGCPMKCTFCDCPKVGFKGNVSVAEFGGQVTHCIRAAGVTKTNRFNLHFARMGEPTFNNALLEYTKDILPGQVNSLLGGTEVHPVVSTMMPAKNPNLESFLQEWCRIKNEDFKGEAGLQLSINSTCDKQRQEQFLDCSLTLEEISEMVARLPKPVGRKYTLNFAVTKETVINPKMLSELFDKDNFLVKLTPIHLTEAAVVNEYDLKSDFDVYDQFEEPLLAEGWQVIVFIPSKEEDADRITCGNALIALGK